MDYDFSRLPYETQFQYLLGLPYQTIIKYCQTNRTANQICQSQIFWKQKIKQDFGIDILIEEDEPALEYAHLEEAYQKEPWNFLTDLVEAKSYYHLNKVLSRINLGHYFNDIRYFLLTTQDPKIAEIIWKNLWHQRRTFKNFSRLLDLFKYLSDNDKFDALHWYLNLYDYYFYHAAFNQGDLDKVIERLPEAERLFGREGILWNALDSTNLRIREFFFNRYADLLRDPKFFIEPHEFLIEGILDVNGQFWLYDEFLTLGAGVIDLNQEKELLEGFGNPPELVRILENHLNR